MYNVLQWKLPDLDTLGTEESVLISEVSSFQGVLMEKFVHKLFLNTYAIILCCQQCIVGLQEGFTCTEPLQILWQLARSMWQLPLNNGCALTSTTPSRRTGDLN